MKRDREVRDIWQELGLEEMSDFSDDNLSGVLIYSYVYVCLLAPQVEHHGIHAADVTAHIEQVSDRIANTVAGDVGQCRAFDDAGSFWVSEHKCISADHMARTTASNTTLVTLAYVGYCG